MIYKARVIDNSMFKKTGKIRIRIFEKTQYSADKKDLSENYKSITANMYKSTENGQTVYKYTDSDAIVYSQIGGGYDFGMFMLPQVNAVGIVSTIGENWDNAPEYVWLGAYFELNADNNINIPSDKESSADGVEDGTVNITNLNGAFVMKLKHTELKDATSPSQSVKTMDWKQRQIENMVVIDKDKVNIVHNTLDSSDDTKISDSSYFTMDSEGIRMEYNAQSGNSSSLNVNSDGTFSIAQSTTKGVSTSVATESNGEMSLMVSKGNNASIIKETPDSVSIILGSANITLENDSINISTNGDVNFQVGEGGRVNLGTQGKRVLLAENDEDSFEIDNHVITASKELYG